MLSLIICSRTPRISDEFEKNIVNTIGCDFELVVIDNSKSTYNIFSAYNEGIIRSKGDVLCFMHDDLRFRTENWGRKVETYISNSQNIGVVGVIGSYCLTKDCCYWDMMTPYVTGRVPVGNNKDKEAVYNGNYYFDEHCSAEVVAVDGMWFCVPKTIFSKIAFDEKTFSGYHFYDMDICMQALHAGYKNVVIRDIEILHMCHPQYNCCFLLSMKKFCEKWEQELPIFRGEAIEMDEKDYYRLHETTVQYCKLLEKYNDITNSLSFKLGHFLLTPFRFIRNMLRK